MRSREYRLVTTPRRKNIWWAEIQYKTFWGWRYETSFPAESDEDAVEIALDYFYRSGADHFRNIYDMGRRRK